MKVKDMSDDDVLLQISEGLVTLGVKITFPATDKSVEAIRTLDLSPDKAEELGQRLVRYADIARSIAPIAEFMPSIPGWSRTEDGYVRNDFVERSDGYHQGARITLTTNRARPWKVIYRRGVPCGTTDSGDPNYAISRMDYSSPTVAMHETDARFPRESESVEEA